MQNQSEEAAMIDAALAKRGIPPVVKADDTHERPEPARTLAQQVDQLACRCIVLEGIAGEMLATIALNVERGFLVAQNDDGKLRLAEIIQRWTRQLAEVDEIYPKQRLATLRSNSENE